ncbi:MAG: hypothetical protein A2104_01895 [Candidatus Melainabacteria bacterium GWF2_32_7]|nr:MAG: hypothetical protein A2104_01895 [Candidatus Melainabacteria bacterium GWF2_32_7]
MLIGAINNDIIKILFNTQKEELLLGNLIKIINEENNGVIAQVFGIENSKKTASNNIANVKILLTLKQSNKWYEWEGNIPSKEFKVEKVSNKELISYISGLKQKNPVTLGYLSLYDNAKLDIEAANFENPTVILSDKQYQRVNTSYLLAQELVNNQAKVVLFDFTGEYSHITTANRLEAGRNFKLPLNSKGVESIYDKSLVNVSAETRAIIEDIFMSLQEYIEESQLGFIPFTHFKKVVNDEYEENRTTELILLRNKLTKIEKQNIFANNKFETESFKMCIKNTDFIIVDFSRISSSWHKNFVDYIIDLNIEDYNQRFFVIFNANETNIDSDLITKLYIQGYRSGIKPIVSVDYKSKYFNNVLSVAKNMIMYSPEINSNKLSNFEVFLNKLNNKEALLYGDITQSIPLIVRIDNISSEFEYKENKRIFENSFIEAPELEIIENPKQKDKINKVKIHNKEDNFVYEEIKNPQKEEIPIDQETNEDYFLDIIYNETDENKDYQFADDLLQEENTKIDEEYSYVDNNLDFDYTEEDLEEFQKTQSHVNDNNEDLFQEEYIEMPDYVEDDNNENSYLVSVNEVSNIEEALTEEFSNTNNDYNEIPSADIPIYSTVSPESIEEEQMIFNEGDAVKHNKYGLGVIKKVIGYGNKKLCSIQFENIGRRLLDPTLTVLEKI